MIGKTIKNVSDINEDDYKEVFTLTFDDDSVVEIEANGVDGGYFVLYEV